MSAKVGCMTRSVVDATEKYNSYSNDVYTNNKHVHLNPRYALLANTIQSSLWIVGSAFPMCPSTIQYVPQELYTPRRNGNCKL